VRPPASVGLLADKPGETRSIEALVADPTRHRLIAATTDDPAALRIVYPASPTMVDGPPTSLSRVTLADVDAQIWIAGYGNDGSQIRKLAPVTLLPGLAVTVSSKATLGAVVIAGSISLWARSDPAGAVICLDAVTGDVNAAWTGIHGSIASQDSIHPLVYTIRANHVVRLETPAPCQG
jgi:hypothetical protein